MGLTFLSMDASTPSGREITKLMEEGEQQLSKVSAPPEGPLPQPQYSKDKPRIYYVVRGSAMVVVRQEGFTAIGAGHVFRAVLVTAGLPIAVTPTAGSELAIFEGGKMVDAILMPSSPKEEDSSTEVQA